MNRPPVIWWSLLVLTGCMAADRAASPEPQAVEERFVELKMEKEMAPGAPPVPAPSMAAATMDEGRMGGGLMRADAIGAREKDKNGADDADGHGAKPADEEEQEPAATRAWFPESFLFEPAVVTNAAGEATVDVTVPDQLTTWRVLALAHARAGSQAGTEARFTSTLPRYVDVVAPPSLRVGDRLKLPLQAVNNEATAWSGALTAEVRGEALRGQATAPVALAPFASSVRYLEVEAVRPGSATVAVDLGQADRVEKVLSVIPTGKRLDRSQGGTLASPRSMDLLVPAGAVPGASTLDLVVWPGPLAVIVEELGLASARGSALADQSYAWALTASGRDLAKKLGTKVDEAAFRKSRLLSWQKVVTLTRGADPLAAITALAALRNAGEDESARKLADRLAQAIAAAQSPDGSFAMAWSGTTSVERAVVVSAEAARVTGDRQKLVAKRASAFIERNLASVQDPYTAAVVLGAGLASGGSREKLAKIVKAAVVVRADGSRVLEPTPNSLRVDGGRPGMADATARAVLALRDDPEAKTFLPDLGAGLVALYAPAWGFGDGASGLAALDALAVLFEDRLPESVKVRLSVDGAEVAVQDMTLAGSLTPLVVHAPAPSSAGPHTVAVKADPAVPGLLFNVTLTSWLPWSTARPAEGFTLVVTTPPRAVVGQRLPVSLKAAAPGGQDFVVELRLPVGVEADEASLQGLAQAGVIRSFLAAKDLVRLTCPAMAQGSTFQATFDAIPTLGGALQWGGTVLSLVDEPDRRVEASPGVLVVAVPGA